MNREEEFNLVYHLKHGRSMPGCLPLFVLIAGVLVVLGMGLVEVQKPTPLRSRGEGNVYYRNDELLRFHVFQRSPLPLRLPVSVDPAQTPDREMPPLSAERQVELLPAPAPSLFGSAPDSAVLEKASLLRLPPQEEEESSMPPAGIHPSELLPSEASPLGEGTAKPSMEGAAPQNEETEAPATGGSLPEKEVQP